MNKKDRCTAEVQVLSKWLETTELIKKLKNDSIEERSLECLLIFASLNLEYERYDNEKFIFYKGRIF